MTVPLCDLTRQYLPLKDEIDAAMQAVAAEGRYILGPNVKALEREVAEYCECEYAVAVNSGTDALHLALRALDVGPGDEVITTPFTFIATTEAICMVGATPVLVDVDPRTFNLSPPLVEKAVTSRTKAILPVHLYGQPCDMNAIIQIAHDHGLLVVEDCAQAMGATYAGRKVGSFGVAGCLSFFPSKNLGCFGDGGMVVTNDRHLYERVEMLRRHGGKLKYHHTEPGLNSRLDELQAAVLRVKFCRLDAWNRLRREAAYRYNKLLEPLPGVVRPAEITTRNALVPTSIQKAGDLVTPVYHQYTVLVDDRDAAVAALRAADVGCAVYYPVPLHLQQVHAGLGYRPGDLPNAESVAGTCLSLPMFPGIQQFQQELVAGRLKAVRTDVGGTSAASGQSRPPMQSASHAVKPISRFSLDSYRSLLGEFLHAGYEFVGFQQIGATCAVDQPLVVLRHDIDMDLGRALTVARVEAELGIKATYFFLLRTEHYNLFSRQGSDLVGAILDLGHELGLHFDCAAYDEASDPGSYAPPVNREAAVLANWFDRPVSMVSFHRPSAIVLSGSPELSHPLEHVYMKKYFERIQYCSDSRGQFRYGHPTDTKAFAHRQPMQLLTHPIWWGDVAATPVEALDQLVDRRQEAFLQSLQDNCTVFQRPQRRSAA